MTAADAVVVAAGRLPGHRSWYGWLLGGLLPILVLGFFASALANRIIFLGWMAIVAPLFVRLLYLGFARGWSRRELAAAALGALALGLVPYGFLMRREHEELDLGVRAFLPAIHHPWLTAPATWWGLAAALALAGIGCAVYARRSS